MATSIDEIFEKDAFKALDVNQKEAFKSLFAKLDGKSGSEALPIIMSFIASMPKGKKISSEEKNLMVNAAIESMSEADRERFKSIMSIIDNGK